MTSKTKTFADKSSSFVGNKLSAGYNKADISPGNQSLAQKMSQRLLKYERSIQFLNPEEYQTKSSGKSGNNPLYNYPSIPSPMIFDPKYSRNAKEKYTKFVTTATVDGKVHNISETISKLIL